MMVTTGARGNEIARNVRDVEEAFFDVGVGHALDRVAEFAGEKLGQIGVDNVAGGHHLTLLHQIFDEIHGAFGHALRQFLNGNGFGQDDFAGNLLAHFLHLRAAEFFLTAARRGHGAGARV